MGDVGEFFFGGKEEAKQTGTTSPTFASQGQKELFDQLISLMQGQLGAGITPYPGSSTAGPQPLQNLSFDMIQQLLQGLPGGASSIPQVQQAGGTLSNILGTGLKTNVSGAPTYASGAGTLDKLLQDWDPSQATEMWKSTYVNPALDTWRKDIAPAIKEQFIARNAQYSQALPDALAKSATTMDTNLNAQLANILYNSEQANKAQQQTGVNQALQYAQLPLSLSESAANRQVGGVDQSLNYGNTILDSIMKEIGTAATGGSTQYGIAQNQAQGQFNQWLSAQPYANPWLQYLGMGLDKGWTQPIVQGPTQTTGLLTGMLSGLGSGAGQIWGQRIASK